MAKLANEIARVPLSRRTLFAPSATRLNFSKSELLEVTCGPYKVTQVMLAHVADIENSYIYAHRWL